MRFWAMAFSRVVLTCSWLTTSRNVCGRYLRAMTWYMGWGRSGHGPDPNARPRVIRGTRTTPLPLLPSGPGGVCSRPLHGARDLTSIYRSMWDAGDLPAGETAGWCDAPAAHSKRGGLHSGRCHRTPRFSGARTRRAITIEEVGGGELIGSGSGLFPHGSSIIRACAILHW